VHRLKTKSYALTAKILIFIKQKSAHPVAEVSASQVIIFKKLEEGRIIFFGNPAVLSVRIRGFASPDHSGFALSIDSHRYIL